MEENNNNQQTEQCNLHIASNSNFAEKCGNCQLLGVWDGFGMDEGDMHLCNMLGATVYANSDPCEDYIKVK